MPERLIVITPDELFGLIKKAVKDSLPQNERSQEQKLHMTVGECSEYTGIAIPTLYQKSSRREIPSSKIGGRLIFNKKEIDAWIASKRRVTVEGI
jgi:excisionase family DNA binding protein